MAARVTGGCLCGAVTFSFPEGPIARRACRCRDCQYLAAGNSSVNAIFRKPGFACAGKVAGYESLADSGTPLFSEGGDPAGHLDDRELGRPESFIWTGLAPSLGHVDSNLANCEGQPAAVRT